MDKSDNAYKTIGEVVKILKLKSNRKGTLPTHTIRFWEKQFKQIKPNIFSGNRRYYNDQAVQLLKKIKYLLKDKGMTIKGVKNQLQDQNSELDESYNKTINNQIIKTKVRKIANLLKGIKNNG